MSAALGNDLLGPDDLRYSAYTRCKCGFGLAYPKIGKHTDSWDCADYLLGVVLEGEHDSFPFMFFEIKSEDQPSANGATTRIKK